MKRLLLKLHQGILGRKERWSIVKNMIPRAKLSVILKGGFFSTCRDWNSSNAHLSLPCYVIVLNFFLVLAYERTVTVMSWVHDTRREIGHQYVYTWQCVLGRVSVTIFMVRNRENDGTESQRQRGWYMYNASWCFSLMTMTLKSQ